MNKQLRAAALAAAAILLLVLHLAPPVAGATVITVTADRTEVSAGETVTFTVILGPVTEMGTMQMVLDIPEGLSYKAGSGKLAPGLRETLGYDAADFTEGSLMINGMASAADYSSLTDTQLCTFQCTADEGFSGTVRVGLSELEFYSCRTWEDHTGEFTVNEAVITISGTPGGQEAGSAEETAGESGQNAGNPDQKDTIPDSHDFRSLHKKAMKKEHGNRRPAEMAGKKQHAEKDPG